MNLPFSMSTFGLLSASEPVPLNLHQSGIAVILTIPQVLSAFLPSPFLFFPPTFCFFCLRCSLRPFFECRNTMWHCLSIFVVHMSYFILAIHPSCLRLCPLPRPPGVPCSRGGGMILQTRGCHLLCRVGKVPPVFTAVIRKHYLSQL